MTKPVLLACVVAASTAACTTETSTIVSHQVDLAGVSNQTSLIVTHTQSPPQLELTVADPACNSLSVNVDATVDGQSGNFFRAATFTSGHEDFGHGYEDCEYPYVVWSPEAAGEGPATFELSDGTTFWSMVVESPTVARTLDGITPGATLHGGDTVTVTMTPAGALSSTESVVRITTATGTISLTPSTGLTVGASTLTFTLPAVTDAADATVHVETRVSASVLECNARVKCEVMSDHYAKDVAISLAP